MWRFFWDKEQSETAPSGLPDSNGDEAWEAGSDDDDLDSECDSETETATSRDHTPNLQQRKPCIVPDQSKSAPLALSDARSKEVVPRLPAVQTRASAVVSHAPPAETASPDEMTLVAHLREDNTRLREALIAAQREAEAMASERGKDVQSVDFGHLLSLVKEFGDDLGGVEGLSSAIVSSGHEEISPNAVQAPAKGQTFSISSPRGEAAAADASSGADEDLSLLRAQLATSQQEVAELKRRLAKKDEREKMLLKLLLNS